MFEHNLFILTLSAGDLLLFAGVLILVFGASQIPKVARSLGEGLKEFKKAVREAKDEDEDQGKGDTAQANATVNKEKQETPKA